MSLKKRLEEKSAGLGEGLGGWMGGASRSPKTGPGQMLAVRAMMDESAARVEELEERLKTWDGAQPTRALDASRVVPSRWANRHARSFEDAAFAALKAEIQAAGGNVQPIRVRPLQGRADADYEIVFGHRRHRACLELGLPVSAVIEPMEDVALFVAMDRENRQRKDLSAWEQGMMYRRALDEGLFPSMRQMADRLGVDAGNVSKALSLARLPVEVVGAFESPLDLQFRWAAALSEALQKDPEGVVRRASEVARNTPRPAASAVLDRLLGIERVPAGRQWPVQAGERRLAVVKERAGRYSVEFDKGVLDEAGAARIAQELGRLLG